MGLGKGIFFMACFAIAMKYVRTGYRKAGMAYGLVFGVSQTIGKLILDDNIQNVSLDGGIFSKEYVILFVVAAMGAGGMAAIAFAFLEWACKRQSEQGDKGHRTKTQKEKKRKAPISFWLIYPVMLLCYLPCFIAYFPGCMSYDSWYITLEALGIIGFDNHHPFLHTFLWSIFAHMDEWLGIKQIGITLYTITQLLVMAAIYAYTCVWISKRNLSGSFMKIACVYYTLNPVFHIFTLILTKDVLFSGLFLLLSITLVDFFEAIYGREESPVEGRLQLKLTILLFLSCLFRNNMIYVVIAFTILLGLAFRVSFSQCKGFFIAILLFCIVTKIVYPGFHVAKGSVKEMLPVPLSQIAAVYHSKGESIEAEEKELIQKYIPGVEQYDRFFADPIKADFNEHAFAENKEEFFRLWGRLFRKYPIVYGKAFLALNLPFWYPEMESVREYIETDNYSQDYSAARKGWLPRVYGWYETVSENKAAWMHFPFFRQLYAIGVPVWVLIFFSTWFGIKKRKAALTAGVFSILLWMTYLLGPVSSFRYAEPLLLTYPLWAALGAEASGQL